MLTGQPGGGLIPIDNDLAIIKSGIKQLLSRYNVSHIPDLSHHFCQARDVNGHEAMRAAAMKKSRVKGLWLAGWIAALVLGLGWAAVHRSATPPTAPVNQASTRTPEALVAMAQDAALDAPMPVDLHKFALNALLLPLLDDATPPRWSDLAIDFACDPGSSVLVNGKPMVPGKPIPATTFNLRWKMQRCTPMGRESVELSGGVELVVSHTPFGLSATVVPDRLRVDSHLGRSWLRGSFTAEAVLFTHGRYGDGVAPGRTLGE